MKKVLRTFLLAAVLLTLLVSVSLCTAADDNGRWVTAWGTGSTNIALDGLENITAYVGQLTFRTVITPTASGSMIRIRLSNYFGTEPMDIETCTVAKSLGGSRIDEDSLRFVTFSGYPKVTIPANGEVMSDPVSFNVVAQEDIAMSCYLKNFADVKTMGLSGGETYLKVGEADNTRTESFGLLAGKLDDEYIKIFESAGFPLDISLSYSIIHVVPVFTSVDVFSPDTNGYSVVVVGDSTVSNDFPQYLSEMIVNENITNVGVVGKGIIGNSLGRDGLGFGKFLFGESMLNRFRRDVLSQSGVDYVIVKIGTNDIVHPVCTDVMEENPGIKQPTAEEIIENFRTVFRLCHENKIHVIAVGITQWKGYTRNFLNTGDRYKRTEAEREADWQIALKVNEWLATTNEHDGYVDFYDITKNPEDPEAMAPEYTLDGAHPTQLMQKVWAQNFPLSLIGIGQKVGYVRLNQINMQLKMQQTGKLKATVYPVGATNKDVYWSSSNPSVATVDSNGTVTALQPGKAIITCTTADGAKTSSCTVTVTVPATGIVVNQKTVSIYTTKTTTLTASVLPEEASLRDCAWSSANPKIATVDPVTGVVTGVGAGTTKITCTTADGGFSDTCSVTVIKKTEVESLKLNTASKGLYLGYTYQLTATISPDNATFQELIWRSDNVKVATVDANGKVKAVGVGTAYITCASEDNPFVSQRCKIVVSIPVQGVSLDQSSVSLYETETKTLKATISPSNATNKKLIWSSSDTSVATVNAKGVVSAVSRGKAVITCMTKNRGKTATCKVTVQKTVHSTSVGIDRTSVTIYDGKSVTLHANIKPANVSLNTVIWSSSNSKIAKVDSKGNVTGVSPGTCKITCTTRDTGKKASCVVTVKSTPVKSVTLDKTSMTITVDQVVKLKATVSPKTASNQNVKWSSSNSKVLKVSQKGNVKGLKAGTATVTCTSVDGGKTAACTVRVKAPKIKSITPDKDEISLGINGQKTIGFSVTPATADKTKVKYYTSDSRIAKVNAKGVITGISEGSCIITIKPNDGGNGKEALIVVEVSDKPVTGIKLTSSVNMLLNTVTVSKGDTFKLTATVMPVDATNRDVVWRSSNTNVAKVNSKGKVTAVGTGTCTITCVSTEQKNPATAVCRVYVR